MANRAGGQLFSKRWPLSNPNRTKSSKMKHGRNSDSKTGNRDHIRTAALERSVMNYWAGGLNSFYAGNLTLRKALSREFCPACPLELVYTDDTMIRTEFMEEVLVKLQTWKSLMKMKGLWVIMV